MRQLSKFNVYGFSAEDTMEIVEQLEALDARLASRGTVQTRSIPEGLEESTEWTGRSPEGLNYSIKFWGKGHMCDGHGMWNYYIHLYQQQFTPEQWARVWLPLREVAKWGGGTPLYDEWESVFQSYGEFHGGVTHYSKRAVVDVEGQQSVKVGCDYGHAFDRDRGYPYDVHSVNRDALYTCRLLAAELKPRMRCDWTGAYFDPAYDMAPSDYKGHLSPAGLGGRSRALRERDEERRVSPRERGA